jgi:predicted DNA binding CopG/RHH family protein
MKHAKLTKAEKAIEDALIKGECLDASKDEFKRVAAAIAGRKKDAVLHVRVNSQDLDRIKKKAKQYGIRYQTFVSEFIHKLAQ